VQSDLATKKISDIKRIPRPSAGTGTTPQPKPGDKPWERPEEGSGNRPESKPGNTPGNRPEDMRDSGPMRG
jgi:hypothetical protein